MKKKGKRRETQKRNGKGTKKNDKGREIMEKRGRKGKEK